MTAYDISVARRAVKPDRRPLRTIGVDEVSYGRGQSKYLTIVWDHERSRIVWIGKGRDRGTLGSFFTKLGLYWSSVNATGQVERYAG